MYLQKMLDLTRKINPRENVVGWYTTGVGITPQTVDVHQYFVERYLPEPIHLMADPAETGDRISLSAVIR